MKVVRIVQKKLIFLNHTRVSCQYYAPPTTGAWRVFPVRKDLLPKEGITSNIKKISIDRVRLSNPHTPSFTSRPNNGLQGTEGHRFGRGNVRV